jgi:CubicO group peptidase (beta-lactamase class C family)
MEKQCLILLAVLLLTAIACPSSQTLPTVKASNVQERDYWPTSGWLKSEPEEQGMNSTILDEMVELIWNDCIAPNGVVVVRHGYVVLEQYPNDLYDGTWGHPLYSVTKSFTSALVGIAIKEGYIESVEDNVLDFFPERNITNVDARKEAMTLEHVLTMTSGVQWDEWTYPYTDSRNDIRNLSAPQTGCSSCLTAQWSTTQEQNRRTTVAARIFSWQ